MRCGFFYRECRGSGRDFEKCPSRTGREELFRNLPSSFFFLLILLLLLLLRCRRRRCFLLLGSRIAGSLGISADGKRGAFRKRILRYERLQGKMGRDAGASFNSQPTVAVCESCSTRTRREGNLLERSPKRARRESVDRSRRVLASG